MKSLIHISIAAICFCISTKAFSQSDSAKIALADSSAAQMDSTLIEESNRIPVFSVSSGDDGQNSGSQDVSGILQSSRDVFVQNVSFNFSNAGFRLRGLSGENNTILLNGVKMNDYETGMASWSTWGGLNDVTNNTDITTGWGATTNNFGGLAGTTNVICRPSEFRKGHALVYGNSNRNFVHRIAYTYSSGMMENGWAFTFSGSRRYSDASDKVGQFLHSYVPGSYFDGWSWFGGIEKKINAKHALSLIAFGAPTEQGRKKSAIQEAYDLTGSPYYNPNWGYQDGVVRNAKISKNNEPFIQLNHYFTPSEKTKIHTSIFSQISKNSITGINRFDANSPDADYYKYFPSYQLNQYQDSVKYDAMESQILADPSLLQIKWDDMYQSNYNNLYTVNDVDGVAGATFEGKRSRYILEEQVTEQKVFGVNTVVKHKLSERINLAGGLNLSQSTSHNYKIVNDLLGGDFWLDINQFTDRISVDPVASQSNTQEPNHVVKKGDKFGYDYNINVQNAEVFGTGEYNLSNVEIRTSANLNYTSFWREGNFQNGVFSTNSLGKSEVKSFLNYGVKLTVLYKITGRHFVSVNGMWATRPPLTRNAFVSARVRNDFQAKLVNEQVSGGDVNYMIRYPRFKLRATAYYSEIKNQINVRTIYHQEYQSFINYAISNINTMYSGVEFGAEAKVYKGLVANVVYSEGLFIYNSRPTVNVTTDNSTQIYATDKLVYLKNYYLGDMPQRVASGGLKYNGRQNWNVGASLNYYSTIYMVPNPDRRTEEALTNYRTGDPQIEELTKQQLFEAGSIINMSAAKGFRVKKLNFYCTLMINNLLNNQKLITGGFEQMRYDSSNLDRWPPKLEYHLGRTYNATISMRF